MSFRRDLRRSGGSEETGKKLRDDKSPDPDNMHPRVLWEEVEQISVVLGDTFNSSLESGQVPEDWRGTNVTPLRNTGSREELGKYKPVSLTSVVGSVLGRP